MDTITAPKKQRKNEVNEIERIYAAEGVYSKKFTRQLIDFIGFVLNRYSNENSFPDDMVHFTYLRVMERLGAILPEKPKPGFKVKTLPDGSKIKIDVVLEWELSGKKCLFDASRSNLGNYIFAISRHAHSNYTYHYSKKLKELEPPPTELSEPEVFYDMPEDLKSKVLQIDTETDPEYMTESLRRYLLWKQNA